MASNAKEYAASTFSESTVYSYKKPAEKTFIPNRSFKQRVKSVFKDIGTSPFEYEDDKLKTAAVVINMPPSRI